jgi:diadenosine tetraphosphate (Ap4A) HIT family hydrolase
MSYGARVLGAGMQCVYMTAEHNPAAPHDRNAMLTIADYTLADVVGEVLGFAGALSDAAWGFGPYTVPAAQVFYSSSKSFAFVNAKPACAGHVIVASRRRVASCSDLGADELGDLWMSAQAVSDIVRRAHKADATTFVLQDGAAAGQSVAHVHIHVVPRIAGDLADGLAAPSLYHKVRPSTRRQG